MIYAAAMLPQKYLGRTICNWENGGQRGNLCDVKAQSRVCNHDRVDIVERVPTQVVEGVAKDKAREEKPTAQAELDGVLILSKNLLEECGSFFIR